MGFRRIPIPRFAENFGSWAHNPVRSVFRGFGEGRNAVTPLLSRICKELPWNQEFRRNPPFYPLDSRELLYRDTLFFFFLSRKKAE
jgi:hypothetical protein